MRLCFCLYVCLLSICPFAVSQEISGAASGSVELPGHAPVRFVLNDAWYALALEQSTFSEIPSAKEKLLVIEFTVENISPRAAIPNQLKCSAIDQDERFGETSYAQTTGMRLAGTMRTDRGALPPGASRKLYAGIFVAVGSSIDELELSIPGGARTRLAIGNRIRPLPSHLTDGTGSVPDAIPAVQQRQYVLGPFDLTVKSMLRQPIAGDDKRDQVVIPLSVHNRLAEDSKLVGSLIPAYLSDAYGERHAAKGLVKGNGASASTLELAPGQTLDAGLEFVVPKEFTPTTVAVSTRGRRGIGHRYVFDLAGGGGGPSGGEMAGTNDATDRAETSVTGVRTPPLVDATSRVPVATSPSSGSTNAVPEKSSGSDGTVPVPTSSGGLQQHVPTETSYPVVGTTSQSGALAESAARNTVIQELEAARQAPSTPEYTAGTVDRTLADEGVAFAPLPEKNTSSSSTAATPPRLPAPVKNAVFDLQKIRPLSQGEDRGDEYYLVTYRFRGLLGTGTRIHTFDARRQIGFIQSGTNWAFKGREYQIPAAIGQLEFKDLQPYEVYGFVAVLMEANTNTEVQRERAFGWGEFQDDEGVLEVLADRFDRAVPRLAARPAYEDRTCEVVTFVDGTVRAGIASQFAQADVIAAIQSSFSPLQNKPPLGFAAIFTPDSDRIVGWMGGFGINLPGGESCFPERTSSGSSRFSPLLPTPGPIRYKLEGLSGIVEIEGEHRLYE